MGFFGETDAERRQRWERESERDRLRLERNMEWEADALKRMLAAFQRLSESDCEEIMFRVCQRNHSENTNTTRKASIYQDCTSIANDLADLRAVARAQT